LMLAKSTTLICTLGNVDMRSKYSFLWSLRRLDAFLLMKVTTSGATGSLF
jgi:hypothetical protein